MPVISTNTAANSAVRYLNINAAEQSDSLSKLASGSRITQASDDAAGLAISTRISSDVTTLTQAATNAAHGVSVLQTADGGASNISDILERMKALATESASGTVTDDDRTYINEEFQQLTEQVDTIATGTRYNGQSLLDGSSAFDSSTGGTNVVVGSSSDDTIKVSINSLTSTDLGLSSGTSATAATLTSTNLDNIKLDIGTAADPANSYTFSIKSGSTTTDIKLDATNAAAADTSGDGVLSGEEIYTAISTQLAAATTPGVSASYDTETGRMKLTSSTTGTSSSLSLSVTGTDSTGTTLSGLSLDDLGYSVSSATGLAANDTIDVSSQDAANQALNVLDTAIDTVSAARANIGAQESRFNFTSDSIATSIENLSSANSAITDVDVASEEAKLASAQVKVQAAVAAASSANQMTQNLLKLLQ